MNKVSDFAKAHGYETVDYLGTWHGYKCYEPIMNDDEVSMIGLPLFIMEKGNLIRMSTQEEAMQQIQEFV